MKQIKIALLACFILGASHQVDAQDTRYNSFIGRWYHNTVARYNGYYNARNKMKGANKDLSSSLQDDYERILPLDKSELATRAAIPDIDSIIMRLSVVNKLHSKSRWVDDNLLLIGKAYYLKKDYESAQQTFQYISGTYKPAKGEHINRSSGGKKLEYEDINIPWLKPKRSFSLKQETVRDQALVWMVKSYIKLKYFEEAETIIKLIEKNTEFSFKWRDDLESIHAQMLIDQKRYKDAIKPLVYAIAMTDDKRVKTRYVFVLGQLYQQLGNTDKAIKKYKEVLTLKPDYKMAFNANINMARTYATSGKSGGTEVIDILNKLARDAKYDEFRDQVYYNIGEIYYAQKNLQTATEYYRKSISSSMDNVNQKGMAYLRLGEMSFNDKVYPTSKKYYDSTLAFINKDYPNYAAVQQRSYVLSNLVQQLNTIQMEDSLQKLANMSEKDRNKAVSTALANWEREQQRIKDNLLSFSNPQNSFNKQMAGEAAGAFYFYNVALKSSGYSEFIGRYGNRKNEDNWRRANKKSDVTALDNPDANGPGKDEKTEVEKVTTESLLANIPLTPEKMTLSKHKLAEAYYKLGVIYKQDLNSDKTALQTFEALETKHSGNDFEPQAWYQMYLIHSAMNDGRADEYKNLLLQTYPEDPLSKFLVNPNYADDQNTESKPAEKFYNYAYSLYDAGQFLRTIHAVDSSKVLFATNPFTAKFDLLKTFSIGQTQPKDSFKAALTNFTQRYTTGPEQQRAKELLAMLNAPQGSSLQPKEKKADELVSMGTYTLHPTSPQFIVIMFDEINPSNKIISDSLSAINSKYHGSENLKVNTMLLDDKRQMIMVKQFKNSTSGFAYYNELLEHENLFNSIETTYRIFVIDDKNFPTFFKNKNIDQYQAFFENNYK